MAWVEKRGDQWRVRYRSRTGRKLVYPGLYDTKTMAKEIADGIEVDQRRGAFLDPAGALTPFEEWAGLVLRARPGERSTQAKKQRLYDMHVLPAWRGHALGDIRQLAVQAWVTSLGEDRPAGKGLASETVAACYHILTRIMTAAVDNELLAKSPCRNIDLGGRPSRKAVALDPQQAAAIMVGVTPAERTYALTLLGTGLRFGEAAGLVRSDVRLMHRIPGVRGVIPIVKVVEPLREVEGFLERARGPKSEAGEREVPVPRTIAALLAAELRPGGGPLDPVFVGPKGGLYRRTNWRTDVWIKALKRARDTKGELLWPAPWPLDDKGHEVNPVHVHDLRHTWASWLEDAGIPRVAVVELIGHRKKGVTERYLHAFPETLVRAARAIDERLAPAAKLLHLAA